MKDFVHLHVHSEYSLLDGYATTKGITQRAAELGMDSIALTDHGVMYGAMDFYAAAKKSGIKPIIGMEAYMAPSSMKDPIVKGGKNYFHLLLLAQNDVGYRNLVKLTSRAHLDGMASRGVFARPRIDWDILEKHHEGLVVTSSCIAGQVIQHLTQKQRKEAREIAARYRDVFGADNYYLELQLHDNTPELEEINDELARIGNELKIPLVVTNDTHFVRREDLDTHTRVMSMGFGLSLREFCAKNYQMDDTYHIMSGEEMWQRFKRYGTAPLENTRRIADMCNLQLDFGRVRLPDLSFIPEGHDATSYLKVVCEEGLMKRFDSKPTEEYIKRLEYELDVINQTGFPDYMLIVWDYVKFARSNGIPAIPRGSAGSSLVLYCLFITDVDPVANKLLFERFLSPERLEMPDIDTDFADSRRAEVLDYIATKYGRENTAQIITYGTLGAKAALRDMGRVLDVPLSEVDKVAKLIPTLPVGTTIAQALDRVPELKQIYDNSPDMHDLIDWAQKVEGRMKSVGTHACGVVVSRNPLEEMVPLQRTTKDEHAVMAAFEGPTLAKMGLLKMDILGLTNLSVVAEALKYIEQTTGTKMWLSDIPLEDRKTFESLGRGETMDVFQFESAGMTRYLMQLKPTRVDDLYAMVALYRPGPLEQIPVYIQNKNNPHNIRYLHPILKPILEDTYGVIVYQEQIMHLLQTVAEYTLGEAYIVIKAISKKNRELMAENSARFKDGCRRKGISAEIADKLWELILPFAGYSFNRPHSTLYGLLSYQTAWLKNNYPTQYMTAVLSAAAGQIEEVTKSVAEAQRLGIAVLPVDINRSSTGFMIEELPASVDMANRLGVRFGLSAIRNVGEGPLTVILREREKGGPFKNLESFCDRVDRSALNKRVLESLIKCGAMDSMPGTRHQKMAILEQALNAGIESQKAREAGQSSMFDLFGGGGGSGASSSVQSIPLPFIKDDAQTHKEQLSWEKELLGMYISDHPIARALEGVNMEGITTLGTIDDTMVGQTHTFVGMIATTRRITTKKGDTMLVATFEDLDSSVELVAFPKTFEKNKQHLEPDSTLRIIAKVDRDSRNDTLKLLLENAEPLSVINSVPAPKTVEDDGLIEEYGSPALAEHVALAPPDGAPHPAEIVGTASPALVPDPSPTVLHTTQINGDGNGHVTNGHGHAINGNGHSTHGNNIANGNGHATNSNNVANGNGHMTNGNGSSTPPPEHEGPVNILRTRTKVGASNGNANGNHSAPAPEPVYSNHQTLRLFFNRTDDFDADVRCLQEIDQVLRDCEGNDEVVITMPNQLGNVLLKLRHGVRCDATLLNALKGVLGEERVVLE